MKRKVVAITGGIGSGKSLVRDIVQKRLFFDGLRQSCQRSVFPSAGSAIRRTTFRKRIRRKRKT